MTQGQIREFWLSQDWTLCNYDIAKATGKSCAGVKGARIRFGFPRGPRKPTVRKVAHNKNRVLFLTVEDFASGTDAELGRRWACSRERIRQLRKAAGLPPSAGTHAIDVSQADWSQTNAEIALEYRGSTHTVSGARKEQGAAVVVPAVTYDGRTMDWS